MQATRNRRSEARNIKNVVTKEDYYFVVRTIKASRVLRDLGFLVQSDILYERAWDIKEKYRLTAFEWIQLRKGI